MDKKSVEAHKIPEKLKKFELPPVEVTIEAIMRGDSCVESCPIALSLEDELPPEWKVAVNRDYISIFDEDMYETQFYNTEFVAGWISHFDYVLGELESLDRLDILDESKPFKISLTLQPDEDGYLERWATGY